jgi:hypothetical protein
VSVDVTKIVVAWLTQSSLVQALNASVHGGTLPESYDPANGPALVVTLAGGSSHTLIPEQDTRVQIRAWSGVNKFLTARAAYNAARDTMHQRTT